MTSTNKFDSLTQIVCNPLKTYQEVLDWDHSSTPWTKNIMTLQPRTKHCLVGRKQNCHELKSSWTQQMRLESNSVPRTLFCHDLKGGYLEDRFINGSSKHDEYRFFHWAGIDTFVYFSHHLITIPPPSWINAGHLHGVKILGTLITEWNDGKAVWQQILESESSLTTFRDILVDICCHFGFDGYLLNVENELEPHQVTKMEKFVKLLHAKLHECVPYAELIWYDSVTKEGKLSWQNELNSFNRSFFDNCDGIFLNYTWKEKNLKTSMENASVRMLDVYVGVDVFGRNCFSGGGFNTCQAVELIRRYNLSLALFAPSWVHECLEVSQFTSLEYIFWQKLWPFLYIHGPTVLPFTTSFCQGYGKEHYQNGKAASNVPWYDLNKQQYQPSIPSCLNPDCAMKLPLPNNQQTQIPSAIDDTANKSVQDTEHNSDRDVQNQDKVQEEQKSVGSFSVQTADAPNTSVLLKNECMDDGIPSVEVIKENPSSTDISCSSNSMNMMDIGCVHHHGQDAFMGGGCLKIQKLSLQDAYLCRLLMCDFACSGQILFSIAIKNIHEVNTSINLVLVLEEVSGRYRKYILVGDTSLDKDTLDQDCKIYPLQSKEVVDIFKQVNPFPQTSVVSGDGVDKSWKMKYYKLNIRGRILEVGAEITGSGDSVLLGFLGIYLCVVQ